MGTANDLPLDPPKATSSVRPPWPALRNSVPTPPAYVPPVSPQRQFGSQRPLVNLDSSAVYVKSDVLPTE